MLFVYRHPRRQALVLFGVIWCFWSKARDGWHWWKTGLAPLLGGLAQIPVMYLVVQQLRHPRRVGLDDRNIYRIMLVVFIAGMGLALVYRATDATAVREHRRYLHEEI